MWRWSVSPAAAPNEATYIDLTYEKGDIVAIDTANNTMTVNCVTPVVVSIASVQKASDFEVGRFVAGDVKSDAMFSLAGD